MEKLGNTENIVFFVVVILSRLVFLLLKNPSFHLSYVYTQRPQLYQVRHWKTLLAHFLSTVSNLIDLFMYCSDVTDTGWCCPVGIRVPSFDRRLASLSSPCPTSSTRCNVRFSHGWRPPQPPRSMSTRLTRLHPRPTSISTLASGTRPPSSHRNWTPRVEVPPSSCTVSIRRVAAHYLRKIRQVAEDVWEQSRESKNSWELSCWGKFVFVYFPNNWCYLRV